MKRIIFLLLLAGIFAATSAQKAHTSFFRPVPSNLFTSDVYSLKTLENASVWLLRPAAGIVATRMTYDKTTKLWDTAPLSAAGLGVGYQHFVELPDGTPYNNFGVNLLLLTTVQLSEVQQASMGIGLFATVFGFINIGCDYQFGMKNLGLDTGVTLRF
jgi:hypothetical protein